MKIFELITELSKYDVLSNTEKDVVLESVNGTDYYLNDIAIGDSKIYIKLTPLEYKGKFYKECELNDIIST